MDILFILSFVIVALYFFIKLFCLLVVKYYKTSIDLVEDYLDGGYDDYDLIQKYDAFVKSKNPLKRRMASLNNMKEVRKVMSEERL
jgi:hypothetical protein